MNRIEEKIKDVTWVPVQEWVEKLRAVKEPGELDAIQRAVDFADRAFEYIIRRLKGRTEREVALDLEFFMRKEGASKLAFDSIIASGENGALPHARPSDRVIRWETGHPRLRLRGRRLLLRHDPYGRRRQERRAAEGDLSARPQGAASGGRRRAPG